MSNPARLLLTIRGFEIISMPIDTRRFWPPDKPFWLIFFENGEWRNCIFLTWQLTVYGSRRQHALKQEKMLRMGRCPETLGALYETRLMCRK